ncbi:ribonuclease III [Polluticoccus soli]|uniref:ribonuclease III n=1 Tax=Polluticoccus soli TaxID=3034150 RepID=UPI0023E276FD|nr:ribonuclease III [Flavipsychrobacter sp. JY13-12]
MRRFTARILHFFSPNKQLVLQLEHLLGYTPKHLPYYQLALMHRSKIEELAQNNERLEFLGDAILGSIVAEYLFKKYPTQPEGYLTEMRSRIVRRETLNNVALRMGLNKLVQYNQNDRGLSRSHIFGNALEALIGAVYLDQGFSRTRKFILKQVIKPYIDIETLESTDTNYKNQLLSWAQKNNYVLTFDTLDEKVEGSRKVFTIGVMLDGELVESGSGYNKKEAGQVAAQKALVKLKVK